MQSEKNNKGNCTFGKNYKNAHKECSKCNSSHPISTCRSKFGYVYLVL